MKTGQFVTTRTLLERGYRFHQWLAGYHTYRKENDENIEYLIHDFIKQEVVTVFYSHE